MIRRALSCSSSAPARTLDHILSASNFAGATTFACEMAARGGAGTVTTSPVAGSSNDDSDEGEDTAEARALRPAPRDFFAGFGAHNYKRV